MGTLDGKVALITGAGQGVGQGIALALASEGAAIAACGRTESKLRETAKLVAARGAKAISIVCDVCRLDDVERSVQTTVRELGGIDILVNNAQIVPLGLLLGVSDAQFEDGWRSGPQATHRFMRAAHQGLPPREFPVPEGVKQVRIDPQTGKLAGASVPGRAEWFLEGTEPTEETRQVDPNDFLLLDQKEGR